MSGNKIISLLLLTSALVGCSQFGPFVDRRREAGGLTNGALYVGVSTPEEPAICYNRLYTSYAEVKALADAECQANNTGATAVPVKETVFTCRLLIPNHYYFKCEK